MLFSALATMALSADSSFLGDPVSADELGNRMALAMREIGKILDKLLVPLVVIFTVIAVMLIIVGSMSKSGALKKTGVMMFLCECGGILLYFSIPLVLGFLRHISDILNGV